MEDGLSAPYDGPNIPADPQNLSVDTSTVWRAVEVSG